MGKHGRRASKSLYSWTTHSAIIAAPASIPCTRATATSVPTTTASSPPARNVATHGPSQSSWNHGPCDGRRRFKEKDEKASRSGRQGQELSQTTKKLVHLFHTDEEVCMVPIEC